VCLTVRGTVPNIWILDHRLRMHHCRTGALSDTHKLYSETIVADDCRALQDVIDKVKTWSDEWQLSMPVRKCATFLLAIVLPVLLVTNTLLVTTVYHYYRLEQPIMQIL